MPFPTNVEFHKLFTEEDEDGYCSPIFENPCFCYHCQKMIQYYHHKIYCYNLEEKPLPKKKTIPKRLRIRIFRRDNFTCKECGYIAKEGIEGLALDHIQPESKGGDLSLENLQTLCTSCNCKKGNKIGWKLKIHSKN